MQRFGATVRIGLLGLFALTTCGQDPPPGPGPVPKFCGGIAGFPCEGGKVCVDDPRDDCDPRRGGADCGGICVTSVDSCEVRHLDPARDYLGRSPADCARIRFSCPTGSTAFFDHCGCGCTK